MKLYVVYGNLDRDADCDYKVYGVFDTEKQATDYAIRIAVTAMDALNTPAQKRECASGYHDSFDNIFAIYENDYYTTDTLVREIDLNTEYDWDWRN